MSKAIPKRLLLALAVIGMFAAIIPPAQAHGTCVARADKPYRAAGNQVGFLGLYDCNGQRHDRIHIIVYAQRRPGSSTSNNWETFHSEGITHLGPSYIGHGYTWSYNCAKDYRTYVAGDATGGHYDDDGSAILQNTC